MTTAISSPAGNRIPASFRDPAGFLFCFNNRIIRFVRGAAIDDFHAFLNSKGGRKLIDAGVVVGSRVLSKAETAELEQHPRVSALIRETAPAAIVEHERVQFQSFPYEWCPEMLHEAGALTINIALEMLREGIGLKDGTPYNVLFRGPEPVFIDLLSFERRDPHDPVWLADAQFTRTFLLPLLAYKYYGLRTNEALSSHRDGLEHEEVYRWTTPTQRIRSPFFGLVSMPAWLGSRKRSDDQTIYKKKVLENTEQAQFILETTLKRAKKALSKVAPPPGAVSSWSDYAVSNNNYSTGQADVKQMFVSAVMREFRPKTVLDVGCNTGGFSRIAAMAGASVVAIDYDPVVLGDLWRKSKAERLDILPLAVNLSRPTPATGWRNEECPSFLDRARGQFDALLMLAVIHHMLVTDRVPLPEILDVAADLTRDVAVIEFVAPTDSMFRRITRGRDHLHADLSEEVFENTSALRFDIVRKVHIEGSSRTLYLLRKRST